MKGVFDVDTVRRIIVGPQVQDFVVVNNIQLIPLLLFMVGSILKLMP